MDIHQNSEKKKNFNFFFLKLFILPFKTIKIYPPLLFTLRLLSPELPQKKKSFPYAKWRLLLLKKKKLFSFFYFSLSHSLFSFSPPPPSTILFVFIFTRFLPSPNSPHQKKKIYDLYGKSKRRSTRHFTIQSIYFI